MDPPLRSEYWVCASSCFSNSTWLNVTVTVFCHYFVQVTWWGGERKSRQRWSVGWDETYWFSLNSLSISCDILPCMMIPELFHMKILFSVPSLISPLAAGKLQSGWKSKSSKWSAKCSAESAHTCTSPNILGCRSMIRRRRQHYLTTPVAILINLRTCGLVDSWVGWVVMWVHGFQNSAAASAKDFIPSQIWTGASVSPAAASTDVEH